MKTWLFVPGHEPRKLRKALESSADVVIADWEDAVPTSKKEEARAVVRDVLSTVPSRPRVTLRINDTRSDHYSEDVLALKGLPLSAVVVPKVSEPAEVQVVAELGLPIIAIIESAMGIENAFDIAKAHPLVERLVLGTMDLMADIGGQWEPDGPVLQYPRSRMLFAGRAAGLAGSIDGVYPLLGDLDGLYREAVTARKLGFTGKLIIHPRQIDVVHRVFTPTEEEIAEAKETIIAFDEAVAAGRSAIRIGERFIDPPMVIWAQNVLRRAGKDASAPPASYDREQGLD
jgi:citrate lyase subunit beta/citryl-CoA lyase